MIYRNSNFILREDGIFVPGAPIVQNSEINDAIRDINCSIEDTDCNLYELCIPRDHARMESCKRVCIEDARCINHYSIYIAEQIGSVRNRRDCLLLCKFPTSDQLFGVYLFMEGGVNYVKYEHKYMLRVTDELDRRIILGFCLKYQDQLKRACYNHTRDQDGYLLLAAADYTYKMMPVRIKHQRGSFDPQYKTLEPYEERATKFINSIAII